MVYRDWNDNIFRSRCLFEPESFCYLDIIQINAVDLIANEGFTSMKHQIGCTIERFRKIEVHKTYFVQVLRLDSFLQRVDLDRSKQRNLIRF